MYIQMAFPTWDTPTTRCGRVSDCEATAQNRGRDAVCANHVVPSTGASHIAIATVKPLPTSASCMFNPLTTHSSTLSFQSNTRLPCTRVATPASLPSARPHNRVHARQRTSSPQLPRVCASTTPHPSLHVWQIIASHHHSFLAYPFPTPV